MFERLEDGQGVAQMMPSTDHLAYLGALSEDGEKWPDGPRILQPIWDAEGDSVVRVSALLHPVPVYFAPLLGTGRTAGKYLIPARVW